jgi:D-aminoacyl-tRNA deacylase
MSSPGQPTTVIVSTTSDVASRTLAAAVVEDCGFGSTGVGLQGKPVFQKGALLLALISEPVIRPPDLDEYFNPAAYVFLSRHSAESGIPSLTVHTTGNFSDDSGLGGNGREVGRSNPDLLKNYIKSLSAKSGEAEGYEVTMEATHHGPTSLLKPVLFVELGAAERNWKDRKAAGVVARALVDSLANPRHWEKAALCLGGTHYPTKFNRLALETDVAPAYVVAKHSLEHLDEATFGQMLQKSSTPVSMAVVDWKGLGKSKEKVVKLVEQFGLEQVRV